MGFESNWGSKKKLKFEQINVKETKSFLYINNNFYFYSNKLNE